MIFAVENIDEEVGNEMDALISLKTDSERMLTLLKGLSRDFSAVWYVDAFEQTVHMVKTQANPLDLLEIRDDAPIKYEMFLNHYIDTIVVPEDRVRMHRVVSLDGLMNYTEEDAINHISFGRIGKNGMRQQYDASFAKVIDEDGKIYFVCGLRDAK